MGRLLRWTALAATLLLLLGPGVAAVWWFVAPVDTVGKVDFEQPLRIPELAESYVDDDGVRTFALTAQEGDHEIAPGRSVQGWGFNGAYLGPTLRAEVGEKVRVEVGNQLHEATSVHWHGMHLPAAMDGGPHQEVEPGGTWSPEWEVDQQPATLWYHPHPHGRTEHQVQRGLAGLFLLDDPDPLARQSLPHDYGVDDVPVVVQDRRIRGDRIAADSNLGDTLLVNGTVGPFLEVTTELVRLRLLNGSASRVYEFGFDDARRFHLVGTDGGLLAAPLARDRLRLSPGERAEIVVALEPGDTTVLRSERPDLGQNAFSSAFHGGRDRFDVLQLRAADRLAPSPPLPRALGQSPALHEDVDGQADRRLELQGRRINGRSMDMSRIDETVTLDTTEVWEVVNTDGSHHNFHVHDVQFQVLSVDGGAPPGELTGWKDTVFLPPGTTIRIALRFSDHSDPDVPYMFHCHLLRHEDRGMMGQFVVVEPGAEADSPPGHHGPHH